METPIQPASHAPRTTGRSTQHRSTRAFIIFLILWVILIGSGIAGAKLYSDHLTTTMTADINKQTNEKLTIMQKQYDERLQAVETNYQNEIAALQSKVDALNELLTFTKDNASTKTDNSNKLFTQLSEVKKQLNELKKNLDVLK
jgi:peptidoglycan hydrolase CwlO-like protein